jgi:hypothetical protein
MDWRIALAGLAVYRVAHMLAREDGPFDLFAIWRDRIGQHNWIGRGFHCVLCISFWLSLLAMAWVMFSQSVILDAVVIWLAIAGLVQMFQQLEDALEKILALIMQGR